MRKNKDSRAFVVPVGKGIPSLEEMYRIEEKDNTGQLAKRTQSEVMLRNCRNVGFKRIKSISAMDLLKNDASSHQAEREHEAQRSIDAAENEGNLEHCENWRIQDGANEASLPDSGRRLAHGSIFEHVFENYDDNVDALLAKIDAYDLKQLDINTDEFGYMHLVEKEDATPPADPPKLSHIGQRRDSIAQRKERDIVSTHNSRLFRATNPEYIALENRRTFKSIWAELDSEIMKEIREEIEKTPHDESGTKPHDCKSSKAGPIQNECETEANNSTKFNGNQYIFTDGIQADLNTNNNNKRSKEAIENDPDFKLLVSPFKDEWLGLDNGGNSSNCKDLPDFASCDDSETNQKKKKTKKRSFWERVVARYIGSKRC